MATVFETRMSSSYQGRQEGLERIKTLTLGDFVNKGSEDNVGMWVMIAVVITVVVAAVAFYMSYVTHTVHSRPIGEREGMQKQYPVGTVRRSGIQVSSPLRTT